jgi:adenylate kinase
MTGITGTPGTGKSAAAFELSRRGIPVLDLKTTVAPYILGHDEDADTDDVDAEQWAEEFSCTDGFLEGTLAHYLPCDRMVVLRCRPDILGERLSGRGYSQKKIRENAEAEALDVILIEVCDRFSPEQIYEIDTTYTDAVSVADQILAFAGGKVKHSFGTLDWSEYVL